MKIKEKVVKRLLDELPRCSKCGKLLNKYGNPLYLYGCLSCKQDFYIFDKVKDSCKQDFYIFDKVEYGT